MPSTPFYPLAPKIAAHHHFDYKQVALGDLLVVINSLTHQKMCLDVRNQFFTFHSTVNTHKWHVTLLCQTKKTIVLDFILKFIIKVTFRINL